MYFIQPPCLTTADKILAKEGESIVFSGLANSVELIYLKVETVSKPVVAFWGGFFPLFYWLN